jgi:hypothetical protein
MAITDLKAHLTKSGATASSDTSAHGIYGRGVEQRMAALEAEFRLLREECVRTRNLIHERETKGRTLMDAYKQVMADFTILFEAQRKENLKREESIRFLLSSIETRIKTEIERVTGGGDDGEQRSGRRGLFGRQK